MKKFYALTALALLALIVAGQALCAPARADRQRVLTLGIYSGGRWDIPTTHSDQFFDDLIARFEAENPGVRVEYKGGILKKDYASWLAEKVLDHSAPDVFLVLPEDLYRLASLGVLEDLGPYMTLEQGFNQQDFFPTALREGVVGGCQCALAYEIAPMLMLVNKTLLTEAGIPYPRNNWTMDDFYNLCAELTRDVDGDGMIDRYGVYGYTWKEAIYANGIRLFSDDGLEGFFNQPAMAEIITFMKALEALNVYHKPTSNDFDSGQVAFRPFLFSAYKAYKPYPYRLKKYSNFEWDCLPLPQGQEAGSSVSVLESALIGMSSRCRDKQLAWSFIRMLLSDAGVQEDLLDDSYGIPVLRAIFEDGAADKLLPSDESLNPGTILQVVMNSVSEPCFRNYNAALALADQKISYIINTQVDTVQALTELNSEVNVILRAP